MYRKITLSELQNVFDLNIIGNDVLIDGLGLCNRSSEHLSILSYLTSEPYWRYVAGNSKIKALILSDEVYSECIKKYDSLLEYTCIISDFPESLFYKIHTYLAKDTDFYEKYNFPFEVGENCKIHSTVIIEEGVILGSNITVEAYSVIKKGTVIGDYSSIGIGTVIGSSGFQALKDNSGRTYNVPHVGGVRIGSNVFIGDQVSICNSLFESSVYVGDNSLIDNHSHIAHDCYVGTNCRLAAGVILFGSSVVEDNSWLSPGSMVMNKVTVANSSFICPNSFVVNNTLKGTKYIGSPAIAIDEYIMREKMILKLSLKRK